MTNINDPEITIAGRAVGRRHEPLFWPDIDIYFRRDEALALSLIDKLADAGCDFLKAAVLQSPDLCLPDAGEIEYFDHIAQKTVARSYRDIIDAQHTPLPMMTRLLEHARSRKLEIVLSVYDLEGLDFAVNEGAVAIKIPSSNITHKVLIEAASKNAAALVLDTGRSSLEEIDRAVAWAKAAGAKGKLLVQHSPAGPPAPPSDFRMGYLPKFAARYSCPVGLSDHHPGLDMIAVGVALGACVIEKGVAGSKTRADIDIAHAFHIDDARDVLSLARDTWAAIGDTPREANGGMDRMGCIAARDLTAGEILSRDDITFAFPAHGLGAEMIDEIIGASIKTNINAGRPIADNVLNRKAHK
ncbi:MAG: spore coat protein [Hyphobacterium sp.]|nr:MAG: spore coat protein [Marinicaulis sp.]GJL98140.1 MAG: spore coat protein [Hyphobacterium sp.]